jgi:hypothetical protein
MAPARRGSAAGWPNGERSKRWPCGSTRAIEDGTPPPEIRDGIQRHYAYIMGSTLAQRNKAVAEKWGREYERVHERAISSFHGCVNTWQSYRDALGLPLETSRDDVEAAYGRHRDRGGWAIPPRPEP